MSLIKAAATIEIVEHAKAGGMIRITTPSADRDRDRVMPLGGRVDRYLRNPIVQWGHQTWEPWQTVGRTTDLEVSEAGITAIFELREPANEADPQHIVLQLWGQQYINTASIGFQPLQAVPNDLGGLDFMAWELLEWSLVPIPANADALRLAYDACPAAAKSYEAWLGKDTPPALVLPDWLQSPEAAAKALAPFLAPAPVGTDPAPEEPAPIDLTAIHRALARLKAAGIKEH